MLDRRQQVIAVNPSSRYGRSLRLAVLGSGFGSAIAYDSGPLRARGVLTSMALTDWVLAEPLRRPAWLYAGAGGYIATGVSPILGTGAFSIGCWVYRDFSGAGDGTLIHWGDAGVTNEDIFFSVDSNGNVLAGSGITGRIWATVVATQTWTHLLFSKPAATTLDNSRLWVNGVEKSGSGGETVTLNLQPDDPAIIGSQIDSAFFHMQGRIAEMCVWAEAFADGDARQLSRREDRTLAGALMNNPVPNHYDWEVIR